MSNLIELVSDCVFSRDHILVEDDGTHVCGLYWMNQGENFYCPMLAKYDLFVDKNNMSHYKCNRDQHVKTMKMLKNVYNKNNRRRQ